ncbi:MAG: glycosyltransferase family 39 protein [Chloroflexi bacterium]|nr:glycosyltransferase family 39 protein [Chloroflexota bacterium]
MGTLLAVTAAFRLLWLDQIPVGWHHDEALMGVMASEVFRGVQRPIFFAAFLGQEPIYIYLSAGMMWLLGGNQDVLPLRLTSAFLGIFTVLLTYLLGRELFNRRVGWIAAGLLSFSFWHVMASRNGYRSVAQPFFEALAVYLAWEGAKRKSGWYFALSGLSLSAVLYTYLASRAFPFVFLVYGIWWVAAKGWPLAMIRRRAFAFMGVSFVGVFPLGLYFLNHPGTFSARMGQVFVFDANSALGSSLTSLLQNITKMLASFTWYGDTLWRYNIPGRPIFGWTVALFLYLGCFILLRDLWKKRAQSAFIMIWIAVMLLPIILSVDVGGYTLRITGLMPALFFLPAIGLAATWDWLDRLRLHVSWVPRYAGPFLIIAILLFEGGISLRDYFLVWAQSDEAASEGMADVVAQARYLNKEAISPDEEVFVSSAYYHHPILAQLAPSVYERLRWINGECCIVFSPQAGRPSLYLFPSSALPTELERYFPAQKMVYRSGFGNGQTKLLAYKLNPEDIQKQVAEILKDPINRRIGTTFGDEIEMIAWRSEDQAKSGEETSITLIWRILKVPKEEDRSLFFHLLDGQEKMWGQGDFASISSYPIAEWRPGDVVIGSYKLKVRNDTPAGVYSLQVGIYNAKSLDRLPTAGDGQGRTSLPLGTIKIIPSKKKIETASIQHPLREKLGDGVRLLGYDLQPLTPNSERQPMRLTLYWQPESKLTKDYTVFVHLLDARNRIIAQSDQEPGRGLSPTSSWDVGEVIADTHDLQIKPKMPDTYRLIAGMYLPPSGERLITQTGGDFILLDSRQASNR